MNNLDRDYLNLLQDILENGVKKETRNGGTLSVFGRQIRHSMKDGFPLLTTKKMYFKGIVVELLWFLRGDTSIKYLLDNDCNIWTGDAYKNYEKWFWDNIPPKADASGKLSQEEFINKIKTDDEFAKKWGELGPVYGKQWRNWKQFKTIHVDELDKTEGIYKIHSTEFTHTDQIQNLINDLKTNSDSRRLMVNSWNVGELDQMVLPPCHYGFQVYTRELSDGERLWICSQKHHIRFGTNDGPTWYNPDNPDRDKLKWMTEDQRQLCDSKNIPTRAISLMYNARSQDVPLGTPFNIASYALLLEIIAKMVNMVPDELITNMGDCHIYLNQIEGIKEQLTREPFELPKIVHMNTDDFYKSLSEDISLLTHLGSSDFQIENYKSHPAIKIPLSN